MSEELKEEQEVESVEEQETTEQEENTEEQEIDELDEDISSEDIDKMSDEEFDEWLNSQTKSSKSNKPEIKEENNQPEQEQVKSETKPSEPAGEPKKDTSEKIDYEAAYKAILKPFKANGKEITPRNIQDVISLMQMGANYTKKMQALAPAKKAVETLNKAGINEEDLNFLIDIHKGDKEAIKTLLKKANIDPIDLDLEEINYTKNKNNIATDSEVEFSDVLTDINDSLPKIRDIMNNTWDEASKKLLLKDHNLLRALHEEIQLDRFDKVQKLVEQEKTFGKYKNVSDLEAYIDVVTKLVNEERQKATTKPNDTKSTSTPKNVPDKSKAAPTKTKPNKGKSNITAQDLFSMSEEDFNKLSIKDLV